MLPRLRSEFRFFSPKFLFLISRPHPQISRNFREIWGLGSPSPIYGTPKQVFGGRPSQHLWQTRPRRPKFRKISRRCAARPARRPKFREISRKISRKSEKGLYRMNMTKRNPVDWILFSRLNRDSSDFVQCSRSYGHKQARRGSEAHLRENQPEHLRGTHTHQQERGGQPASPVLLVLVVRESTRSLLAHCRCGSATVKMGRVSCT